MEEHDDLLLYEELLAEKLIVLGKGARYGQVVFLAGGAASGKGYAATNYMESDKFKIRDVDEWKIAFMKLEKIHKDLSKVQKGVEGKELRKKAIINYARKHANQDNVSPLIPQMPDVDLDTLDLKKAKDVHMLHNLLDNLGIKDKTLDLLLGGATNRDTLPNIMFDITLKNMKALKRTIPKLLAVGYQPHNIHIVWVLADYDIAVRANKKRDRVVPGFALLKTHEGAARTMSEIVRGKIPRNLEGGIYVILARSTVHWTDSKGKKIKVTPKYNNPEGKAKSVIKGFTYITAKEPGKKWAKDPDIQKQLSAWIGKTVPKSVRDELQKAAPKL